MSGADGSPYSREADRPVWGEQRKQHPERLVSGGERLSRQGDGEPVMCELGSEVVVWARNVPDWRTGGPGLLEPLGTVLARWSPLTVLGLVGGRGHGTSVTGLGPPIRPFIGVHSWAVGLPEGSHSEAGLGTAGAAGTGPRAGQHKGEPQRHLHVKGGWAFTASCLGH